MSKVLVLIFLLTAPLLVAQSFFQQEVADSLLSLILDSVESTESYYLINSGNSKLDTYIIHALGNNNVDLRMEQTLATKSIQPNIAKDVQIIKHRSFLFSRQIMQETYTATAEIVDNRTSQVQATMNYSQLVEEPIQDGGIVLWKSILISLVAGTLIYSLWSIE